jgi:hypothetical protein
MRKKEEEWLLLIRFTQHSFMMKHTYFYENLTARKDLIISISF